MPEPASFQGAVVHLRGTAEISTARRMVSDAAAEVLGDDRVADVALVVSELVTNALEYGVGDGAYVNVEVEPGAFVVRVSSESPDTPAPTEGVVPIDAPAGRGLQIVEALADDLQISAVDEDIVVTCRFRAAV